MKRYTFINYFPYQYGFHFWTFKSEQDAWHLIYDWSIMLGFFEIRKLSKIRWV